MAERMAGSEAVLPQVLAALSRRTLSPEEQNAAVWAAGQDWVKKYLMETGEWQRLIEYQREHGLIR